MLILLSFTKMFMLTLCIGSRCLKGTEGIPGLHDMDYIWRVAATAEWTESVPLTDFVNLSCSLAR